MDLRDSSAPRPGLGHPVIEARFRAWEELLRARLDVQPAGLFVAGLFGVEVGEDVTLRCRIPGDGDGVRLVGRVMWRRVQGGSDASAPPGLGVVLKSSSMTAFRKLEETAEQRAPAFGRVEERFPCQVVVRCTFVGGAPVAVAGELADVSPGGARLRSSHRPSVEDRVMLALEGRERIEPPCEGRVRWVRGGPRVPGAATSVGIRLEFVSSEDRRRWEAIVETARQQARLALAAGSS